MLSIKFEDIDYIKRNTKVLLHIRKEYFRGDLTNGKHTGINVLKAKRTILKKINVSFIVHFYLGKYSFSFHTFFM